MSLNSEAVNSHEILEGFTGFFERKVGDIVSSVVVDPRVYNGTILFSATAAVWSK